MTAALRPVDALASAPQYVHHVLPVWLALVPRGTFHVTDESLRALVIREAYRLGHHVHDEVALLRGKLTAPVLVASSADLAKSRRFHAPEVAYMEHGCGQSYGGDRRSARHPAYAGGDGRDGCGLILAPNDVAAARWRERYPSVPVHVIGATRVLTPPEDPRQPLLVVSFHWSGPIPEQVNALQHYRAALGRLAQRFPMAGHAHPRFTDSARSVFKRLGVPFIADIEEVARRATVYAVDNSSTLWELGLTRPVIALNAPQYRRDVEHGLRFWSHIPLAVDDPDELSVVVDSLLTVGEAEAARERRLKVCRDVIPYLDGADRAARLLASWTLPTTALDGPRRAGRA